MTFDKPVFFVRDPVKFPSVNRSHKKHPESNTADPNMVRARTQLAFHILILNLITSSGTSI